MRAPCVIRWPGHIKPGTVFNEMFASLDWVPTFVEIAGGPKGNDLNKQIKAGKYKGIVKTKLDGVNQIDYLTGKSEKSASRRLLLLPGSPYPRPCATRTGRFYYTRWCPTRRLGCLGARLRFTGLRSRTSSAIRSRRTSGAEQKAAVVAGRRPRRAEHGVSV